MIADTITFSRILFSGLLLIFPRHSYPFAVLYLLCGVSDVLDGVVARKFNTESKKGAMLDSIADLIFAIIYAVRILPSIPVPIWIWIWTVLIAAVKITGIILKSKKEHRLFIEHSFLNKFTGLLLFLLPMSTCITDAKYGATFICIVATITTIKEVINIKQ